MKIKLLNFVAISILLASCASSASDISASYVSPMKYSNYDCDQITMERDNIERRVNYLYYSVEKRAKADKTSMAVGMILFWPALFFLKGDSPEAAEYARMKGEYEAIQSMAVQKKCNVTFEADLMDSIEASKNDPSKNN
jgi:hypothetical protein